MECLVLSRVLGLVKILECDIGGLQGFVLFFMGGMGFVGGSSDVA